MNGKIFRAGFRLAWLILWLWRGAALGAESEYSLAIVASSEARATGVGDLAVASLSKVGGLHLVERERLDAIAREYEANVFSEKARTADRLKLGRLTGADALVLLSLFGSATNTWLQMVMADCHTGARLRMASWVFDKGRVAGIVEQIKATVLDVRRAYPQGVAQVVGITPFVSRNLVHDYDPLQRRYAQLLQHALGSVPGVAVIETEEALALQNEQALAGPGRVERIVPVLVEGEFLVKANGTSAPPQISFTVRLTRPPSSAVEVQGGPMTFPEAGAFLSVELLQKILRTNTSSASPVSLERQFDWLVGRADQLAQLGFWWDSSGLREAALLLRPESGQQRLKLITEYGQAVASAMQEVAAVGGWKFNDLPTRRAIARRVEAYQAELAHLEYLIRNRSIDVRRAVELAEGCSLNSIGVPFMLDTIGGRYYRLGQEELMVGENAKEQFIIQVMPELLRWIEAQPMSERDWLLDTWQHMVISATLLRWDRTYRTKDELAFIKRVLTHVVPDRLPEEEFEMQQFLASHGKRYQDQPKGVPAVTEEEWLSFLGELEASGHRVARCYGRYAKICCEYRPGRARSAGELRPVFLRIESLFSDYLKPPVRTFAHERGTRRWMYARIQELRTSVVTEMTKLERPVAANPEPQWNVPKKEDHRSLGRLRFEGTPLMVRRKDSQITLLSGVRYQVGNAWGGILHVTPCGENLDVWWMAGAILFMREKGLLDEVFLENQVHFEDVRWDGSAVWIATRHAGVRVVKPDGTIIARFTSELGLPPADEGILIQPLTNGVAIAVGSLKPLARAWCALLQCDGRGGGSVKVIHEATRVVDSEEDQIQARLKLEGDPALCFRPSWLHRYQTKDGSDFMLVGRNSPSMAGRQRPLQINLKTLKTGVFERELYYANYLGRDSHYSSGGFILETFGGAKLYTSPGASFENGKPWRDLCPDRADRDTVGHQGGFAGTILPFEGSLYLPGGTWWRIDPKTWKSERLVEWRLPQRYESLGLFGISAHYGMVAWDGSGSYRVTVVPK